MATPGRLLDLVENWNLDISEVKYMILDEGDKMLDMGFEKELELITSRIKDARGMIFSATVPLYIQKIAVESFKNPVLLDLVGTEESQIPKTIKHRIVLSENEDQRIDTIIEFSKHNPDLKILIFAETKMQCQNLMTHKGSIFRALHGDMDQKMRTATLQEFRQKGSNVILVATDVASRGLDIDDVDIVIHLGCRNVDSFVHRSGRTGRAGRSGKNFVFSKRSELVTILKFAKDLKIDMEVGTSLLEE